MVATMMSKMLVVMTRCKGLVTANAVVVRLVYQSQSGVFLYQSYVCDQLTFHHRFSA